MPIFDRLGWGRRARRLSAKKKAWWETADEFHPEALYAPTEDYEDFDFDPKWGFDPMGSYTGVPEDGGGEPVQDADDL